MSSLSVQLNGLTRNLTEIFNLLRSNAQQQSQLHIDFTKESGYSEDKIGLISNKNKNECDSSINTDFDTPLLWVNVLDEINYEMTRIKTRQTNLKQLQETNLARLNFNDENTSPNQTKIKELTDELTSMFAHTQKLIRSIKESESNISQSKALQILKENVVSSLLFSLNNLFNTFRTSQSAYLKQLDSRAKYVDNFLLDLNTINFNVNEKTSKENKLEIFSYDFLPQPNAETKSNQEELTITQVQQLLQNEHMTKEREKEVLKISRSIVELNTLFKDVSTLILDQGTILDRIDYNIENSSIKVKKAYKNVEKARNYQKDSWKMQIILILTGIALFLMLLIFFTKT